MTQSARAFRNNLFAAAQGLYAGVRDTTDAPPLVCLGAPGTYQPNTIIAVGLSIAETVTRPTMGTTRSRERQVDISVTFSVYVPASDQDQANALDTCDGLIDTLEQYVRTSPNEKFSGATRDAWVSAIDGPNAAVVTNPNSNQAAGRVAEAIVIVTGFCRY
jgi:hypothetical protein